MTKKVGRGKGNGKNNPYIQIPGFDLALVGERGLLFAVLERGMRDAAGLLAGTVSKEGAALVKSRARQWLGLDGGPFWEGEKDFSFLWICTQLDICPKRVIKIVLELQKSILH